MRPGRPRRDVEGLLLGVLAVLRLDVAVLHHAIDDVVAPFDGALALAERMQQRRRLRQGREIRGLGDAEFVYRLVEVEKRGRRDAIGAEAEIDLVEIKLE